MTSRAQKIAGGSLVLVLSGLVLAAGLPSVASAQVPSDPTRLPGDAPPPSLAAMLRPPSGRPTGRDGPPPDATPAPSMALALEAARAALNACVAEDLRIGVAVVDSAGQLRIGLTADGAAPGLIYAAVQKALAALAYGQPTSVIQDKLRADPSATGPLRPNMSVKPGAVPLMAQGRAIGAIGASGGTAQQDEACAAAGADRIKGRLG
ncbi:MAG TPA: heme-binding protein [Caulobacteraceae bacterium]|nr:heme-binding protein [Caulobacteraceae bacterium]